MPIGAYGLTARDEVTATAIDVNGAQSYRRNARDNREHRKDPRGPRLRKPGVRSREKLTQLARATDKSRLEKAGRSAQG